jgi:hypothetical protein
MAPGPTQPRIQWRVPGALSMGVKRTERETDHSSPYCAKVKECVELYIHSPNTSSWRGAPLKKYRQYYFLPLQCSLPYIKEPESITLLFPSRPYNLRQYIYAHGKAVGVTSWTIWRFFCTPLVVVCHYYSVSVWSEYVVFVSSFCPAQSRCAYHFHYCYFTWHCTKNIFSGFSPHQKLLTE